MTDRRPSYGFAAVAGLLVLVGYVITLAPTVTFWDAGEFIAAARTLGVPHPPGTPLFVMIGHVWAALVPLADYAQRLNLLSAVMSACGAACFFLVAEDTLRQALEGLPAATEQLLRLTGALAASLVAAFTFTMWQNSNETEVYAVAVFTIALICWACLRWRAARGTMRAAHLLLLVLYLAGLSIGNHLLALLAGPAVVAFLLSTVVTDPAPRREDQLTELAQVAVMAGTWALLIGSGLGSTTLIAVGGLCYVAALAFAASQRSTLFALMALAVSFIGVTSYLFLYIRAGHAPMINEAQPDNWDALLAVIRREQYPVRTPLDNPTQFHGPENTGRSLAIIKLQLLNYFQYFDWQWGNGIRTMLGKLPLRVLTTLVFVWLGIVGATLQRRADRSAWWLMFTLWLTTGLGLVAYMNFKPGFSVGYDLFPNSGDHEVRERDYFFIASFVVWGFWAGLGLAQMARTLIERRVLPAGLAAGSAALLVLVPFGGNFDAASRRHNPDARLAADFAYNLLNSVPPYGILFTYGDNDTFPLWWAQEVQGVRQDVLVVCLALAETEWYKKQIRDWPIRPFDEGGAPAIWRNRNPTVPTRKPHSFTDEQIASAQPMLLPQDVPLQIGSLRHVLARGTPLYSRDFVVLRILQDNLGHRPIAWSLTTGGEYYGLERYLLQQGLVMAIQQELVDTTRPEVDMQRILGVALDVPMTDSLLWHTYRYAELMERDAPNIEPTAAGVANNLSLPFAQLAYAYEARGNRERAVENLTRAGRLSTNPALARALQTLIASPEDQPVGPPR
jgi:hypothetical protein